MESDSDADIFITQSEFGKEELSSEEESPLIGLDFDSEPIGEQLASDIGTNQPNGGQKVGLLQVYHLSDISSDEELACVEELAAKTKEPINAGRFTSPKPDHVMKELGTKT